MQGERHPSGLPSRPSSTPAGAATHGPSRPRAWPRAMRPRPTGRAWGGGGAAPAPGSFIKRHACRARKLLYSSPRAASTASVSSRLSSTTTWGGRPGPPCAPSSSSSAFGYTPVATPSAAAPDVSAARISAGVSPTCHRCAMLASARDAARGRGARRRGARRWQRHSTALHVARARTRQRQHRPPHPRRLNCTLRRRGKACFSPLPPPRAWPCAGWRVRKPGRCARTWRHLCAAPRRDGNKLGPVPPHLLRVAAARWGEREARWEHGWEGSGRWAAGLESAWRECQRGS